MPFDPLFGPPASLPGWPDASTDTPFGPALGPAYGWSTQSPRILSAVERGIRPFSAAHLGMFAWAPPIFSLSSTLANLPTPWPQTSSPAVNLPDRPFYGRSGDLTQLGSSPPSAVGQDWPGAAASVPSTPPLAIGSPNPLPSVTWAQSPAPTNVPGLDTSTSPTSSLWGVPPDASPAPAPARSVLFTHQPATLDLGARAPNNLDQSAEDLGVSDWPLSKSGTPFLPPPPPSANSPEQMLAALHWVAPNLVDYFTKPLPPPPPFPSVPGKIPAVDSNPYAPGAVLDAGNLAALVASLATGGETTPLALARMADEAAPSATARILSTAGSNPFGIPLPPDAVLQGLKGSFARGGEETLADLAASQGQTAAGVDPTSTAGAGRNLLGGRGAVGPRLIGSYTPSLNLKFSTAPFGNEAHAEAAKILKAMHPDVRFALNVLPSQRGIDVRVLDPVDIAKVGYEYGEIKPLSASGERRMLNQIFKWGLTPEQVQPITYDASGNVYYGFR